MQRIKWNSWRTTWQSTLSMCSADVLASDRLKSSLSASSTPGSRGRLFSGRSSELNWSNWKLESNSTCHHIRRISELNAGLNHVPLINYKQKSDPRCNTLTPGGHNSPTILHYWLGTTIWWIWKIQISSMGTTRLQKKNLYHESTFVLFN